MSDFIAPLATPSYFQHVVPIFGETFNLLHELQKRPAHRYQVSGRDAIFETRFEFGRTSYITGLYNEEVIDSSLVKLRDVPYDYIVVWLDKVGVTAINFLPSGVTPIATRGTKWVYAIAAPKEWIHVRSKVHWTLSALELMLFTKHTIGRISRANYGLHCNPSSNPLGLFRFTIACAA